MEATAGILRSHLESWRSSPVRWLLDRVSHLARSSEVTGSAAVGQDRWQEMFWNESSHRRAPSARRHSAPRFEQAELWDDRPVRVAPSSPVLPVVPSAPVAETPVVASAPAAPARRLPVSRSAARTVTASATYAQRGRRVRTEDIARYLQVNNAVYGRVVEVRDLALPRRSFNPELQLWRGSEIGTPFVTGS